MMLPLPTPGTPIEEIETPALLIDLEKLEHNIARMAGFFRTVRAELRPHAKTHKTPEIALRQLAAGAIGITCAKLGEAEVMAEAGVRDILIANQVVGRRKVARLAELARRTELMVAVDDEANVRELSEAMRAAGASLRVLVEVNVGMNRCGVEPGAAVLRLARAAADAPGLRFAGLMGYEGHCVLQRDPEKRRADTLAALELLVESKRQVEAAGLSVGIVSGGGTGTYAITGAHPEITEVQAGSYVLMDATYPSVVPEFENALTLLATVISRQADRLVLDVGRKGIGDDLGPAVVRDFPELRFLRTSEEHALCAVEGETRLRPGDKLQLLPGHCCTSCNLHDRLYAHRCGRLDAVWAIQARGRFD